MMTDYDSSHLKCDVTRQLSEGVRLGGNNKCFMTEHCSGDEVDTQKGIYSWKHVAPTSVSNEDNASFSSCCSKL